MGMIPEPIHTTAAAIDRWHESQPRRRSRRLGASSIGDECSRRIWYQFRWAREEKFSGRMLRLFRRGQREEEMVIEDLRAIGCVLNHTGSDQMEIKIAPHVVAYPDGVIESGLPESPNKRHLLEVKTHSAKSFAALSKEGVPHKHMAQMQLNMHGSGIDRCLYVAVCKDTDELYIERVRYDETISAWLVERANMIINAAEAPIGVSTDPTWYQCKMCPVAPVCYKQEAADRNCRTCAFSTPVDDGWMCERWRALIPAHVTDCEAYVPHPDMYPGTIVESAEMWARYSDGRVYGQ